MSYPVRFKSGAENLAGAFHRPPRVRKRVPGILFLHGFGGNRIGHRRLYVNMARFLERNGFACLRFDFAGCGESEGNFERTRPSSQLKDAGNALRFLRSRPEVDPKRIGIIGSSMGGCIALALAGQRTQIKSLVLWAGFARADRIVGANLDRKARQLLSAEGRLDIGGEFIGEKFFREALRLNVLEKPAALRCKLCIIHGSEDTTVPPSESVLIYRRALQDGIEAEHHLIEGADHSFSRAHWRRELYSRTHAWFRKTLVSKKGPNPK